MKYISFFLPDRIDGGAADFASLGGKGANLAEMMSLGIPVPPGFTLTTKGFCLFCESEETLPNVLKDEIQVSIHELEKVTQKEFGGHIPLLLSVRSGAPVSMPGMMDTVLNLGLNDQTVLALAEMTNNAWFAWDSYRRFIQMFADVVLGVPHHYFQDALEVIKKEYHVSSDQEIPLIGMQKIVRSFQKIVTTQQGISFPQDPYVQLFLAIEAVFRSWNSERACYYRRLQNIDANIGTAVNIQSMVFGNMGDTSGSGVVFSRNPSTGDKELFGEYLMNAQGEDVVAGTRTPQKIFIAPEHAFENPVETIWNEVFIALSQTVEILEKHYRTMQDIEFTVENGVLFLLQTRTAKSSAQAMLKIAFDMYEEGILSREEVLHSIDPNKISELFHPILDRDQELEILFSGLAASPGVASGRVIFSAEQMHRYKEKNEPFILLRHETSPEDIEGMNEAVALVTSCGGMTSHAAVVARGIGTPCVCGCASLQVDYQKNQALLDFNNFLIAEGDWLTVDGNSGNIYCGKKKTITTDLEANFMILLEWAKEFSSLAVRTNADTSRDAEKALEFGAVGIGLCRTEHMFFEKEKIHVMRQMILAETKSEYEEALQKMERMQEEDFYQIFQTMSGYPVTIRLLDPPLHEFLPHNESEIFLVAEALGQTSEQVSHRVHSLQEKNPMLGLRGCRLGIVRPEITQMQTRALFHAAIRAEQEGVTVFPEIMIPLVSDAQELKMQREIIEQTFQVLLQEQSYAPKFSLLIGTMIETPRAALMADEIAQYADFISFGTNDLTQTSYGISRDDTHSFFPTYLTQNIFGFDPFVHFDQYGIGQLLILALKKARSVKPYIKAGVCGEHGGDPQSVLFFKTLGLDYISCSPYRVPQAQIASAHI